MDIDEIVKELKKLADEAEKLKESEERKNKSNSKEANSEQEKDMMKIAMQYPIKSHILVKSNENVRENYISLLIYLFGDSKQEEKLRLQRMLLIYRIISSFDKNIDVLKYTEKSLKIGKGFQENIIDLFEPKTKFCFIVDVLLLSMLDLSKQKNKYESIADLLQFSKIDHSQINKAALIAKIILKQDFEAFLNMIEKSKSINYNYFKEYFKSNEYDYIESDFNKIKDIQGNVLLVNATISNCKKIIDFDEYKAKTIHIKNCVFERVKGIKSFNKQVTFEECVFDGNLITSSTTTSFGLWGQSSHTQNEENVIFIAGKGCKFINCKFLDCKVNKHLLNLSKSEIKNCEFTGCSGVDLPCSYLIEIINSDLIGCIFNNCGIKTDRKDRKDTYGGLINITSGKITECKFNNCTAYGESGYGSFSKYSMQIICARTSAVLMNKFVNCTCTTYASSDRTVNSYIIGLNNSKQDNNTFKNCESYHYRYSDRCSSYNVGEI